MQLVLMLIVFLNFYSNPTITIISTICIILAFTLMGLWLAEEKME